MQQTLVPKKLAKKIRGGISFALASAWAVHLEEKSRHLFALGSIEKVIVKLVVWAMFSCSLVLRAYIASSN